MVAIITVAVILLHASLPLGLVVVLGVPVLMAIVGILIRPLHHRQQAYRRPPGRLTTRAADIVTGLRVLRGIGGEATFAARYRAESQEVRGGRGPGGPGRVAAGRRCRSCCRACSWRW